jgi:hypothetical protein
MGIFEAYLASSRDFVDRLLAVGIITIHEITRTGTKNRNQEPASVLRLIVFTRPLLGGAVSLRQVNRVILRTRCQVLSLNIFLQYSFLCVCGFQKAVKSPFANSS